MFILNVCAKHPLSMNYPLSPRFLLIASMLMFFFKTVSASQSICLRFYCHIYIFKSQQWLEARRCLLYYYLNKTTIFMCPLVALTYLQCKSFALYTHHPPITSVWQQGVAVNPDSNYISVKTELSNKLVVCKRHFLQTEWQRQVIKN